MATTGPRSLSTDPLRSFKFNVVIPMSFAGSQGSLGRLGFMQMQGLGINVEPLTYREGGDNLTDLPVDAPVLTVNGYRAMGEIQIGDRVIDPFGEDSKVTEKSVMSQRDVYAVVLADGSTAEASDRHIWEVEVIDTNHKHLVMRVSTEELKSLVENKNRRVLLPKMEPFAYDVAPELPLDPYLLGILLSEGSLEAEGVSFAHGEGDEAVLRQIRAALPEGHFLSPHYQDGVLSSWRISVGNDGPGARNVNGRNVVLQAVRELGLLGHRAWEKFIPEIYALADIVDRLRLLQGIMDGDGWVDTNHCTQFSSSSEQLAVGVQDLIRSLGGRCGSLRRQTGQSYTYNGEQVPCRDKWEFSGICDLRFTPFTMQRKVARFACSEKTSSQFRRVRSVDYVGKKTVQCIEVSASSHLFVHADVCSSNTRKMPGQADFNPITLQRGLFATDNDNWQWMSILFTAIYGKGTPNPVVHGKGDGVSYVNFRTNMYINILQHPNTNPIVTGKGKGVYYNNSYPQQDSIVMMSFKLYSAWISSLAYSDLDAGGNAIAVEMMTLNYEGFDTKWGGGSPVANPIGW